MASTNLPHSTASMTPDPLLVGEPVCPAPLAATRRKNVGSAEQLVSLAAGSILALLGAGRRDWTGLLVAGVGGGLIYRGVSGHCPLYQVLDVNTAMTGTRPERPGVHVVESYLISKPREELYAFWRNFENLPRIMSHLESVRVIDQTKSRWIAKAPSIAGGSMQWDALITTDEPNSHIAWTSLPNAEIAHQGSVQFIAAPGDRGTILRVVLDYDPPMGRLGRWAALLFGEAPEQQIGDDLRNFKRIFEAGELPTILGQPRGACLGLGKLFKE